MPVTGKMIGRKWKCLARGIQNLIVGGKIYSPIQRLLTVNQTTRKGSSSISFEPVRTFDSKRKGCGCSIRGIDDLQWVCSGEFNELLSASKKRGGLVKPVSDMVTFRQAINDCDIIDLGFSGLNFTWNNRRKGNNNIQQRGFFVGMPRHVLSSEGPKQSFLIQASQAMVTLPPNPEFPETEL
ncbi:hypothetical protein QYF36_001576 [Acer negundo]|nr:hypothetical protein QYF36_001576 [Acer negundo]